MELENKRLKREKEMAENTIVEYEAQLVAQEKRLRKARTGPLPHVVQPVTADDAKLEMSLVARTAEITQLAADKNLLELELQELQTKYKCLVTEKDAATHQIETVTHQWRTAQKVSDSMKAKNRTLTEKLQGMEREKEGSLEQQQKDKIKQLEDQLRGMTAKKMVSEEALRKQTQNMKEHYERLLQDAHEKTIKLSQTKEDEDKQLRQELLQSQLEECRIKQSELQAIQQQLIAEREKALQKVIELTEEKRRIVDERNAKVTELQQQVEVFRAATENKEEWVSGTFAIK